MSKLQKAEKHIRAIWKQILLFGKMCRSIPERITQPSRTFIEQLANNKNKIRFLQNKLIHLYYELVYPDMSIYYKIEYLESINSEDYIIPICYGIILFSILSSLILLWVITTV